MPCRENVLGKIDTYSYSLRNILLSIKLMFEWKIIMTHSYSAASQPRHRDGKVPFFR